MGKAITNAGRFKPGKSGNPKGRPAHKRVLTEILKKQGETRYMIGHDSITAQEALARAVWQFVVTGEVWLAGKHLQASSASEWASVVKWLYAHIEPASQTVHEQDEDGEMIVRVVRVDRGEK